MSYSCSIIAYPYRNKQDFANIILNARVITLSRSYEEC